MTNAVERMMKEYDVKLLHYCKDRENCTGFKICWKCQLAEKKYPQFTAEKQIELIKLISNVCRFDVNTDMDGYNTRAYYPSKLRIGVSKEFSQSLNQLMNELKPYIDTAKVKEILEWD